MLDHATGYFMAFGAMMAKARQSREGGSWHVRVSLAQTGRWLWNLGRLADGLKPRDFTGEQVRPFIEKVASGFGPLRSVKHSAILAQTPAFSIHVTFRPKSPNFNPNPKAACFFRLFETSIGQY